MRCEYDALVNNLLEPDCSVRGVAVRHSCELLIQYVLGSESKPASSQDTKPALRQT